MSLELTQREIGRAYENLPVESSQDWVLVAGEQVDAEMAGRSLEGALGEAFEAEVAEKRRVQAFDRYSYPIPGSGPTFVSSLRIVHDILTIRRLEATREDRQASIDALGADIAFMDAEGMEQVHRLREKGVLRIFDQQTGQSMWSVEFDNYPGQDYDEAGCVDSPG